MRVNARPMEATKRERIIDVLRETDVPFTLIAQRFGVSDGVVRRINKMENIRPVKSTHQARWAAKL